MAELNFTGDLGGARQAVRVFSPHGGGESYFIVIDNYYHGNLSKRDGRWIAYLATRSDLETEDICILGEMLDEQL